MRKFAALSCNLLISHGYSTDRMLVASAIVESPQIREIISNTDFIKDKPFKSFRPNEIEMCYFYAVQISPGILTYKLEKYWMAQMRAIVTVL